MSYKLPRNFSDMIDLQAKKKELMKEKVIDLGEYGILKDEIDLTRYSCEQFIRNQRGNPDGRTG